MEGHVSHGIGDLNQVWDSGRMWVDLWRNRECEGERSVARNEMMENRAHKPTCGEQEEDFVTLPPASICQ